MHKGHMPFKLPGIQTVGFQEKLVHALIQELVDVDEQDSGGCKAIQDWD
jgi:hypothetical protein